MNVPANVHAPRFFELLMLFPKGWPFDSNDIRRPEYYWPIQLLIDIVNHVHGNNTWIGYGHTFTSNDINLNSCYLYKYSKFHALVSLPSVTLHDHAYFLEDPNSNEKTIFPALIPIYQSELNYKKQHGIEALTDLFDRKKVKGDILDVKRISVVNNQQI